MKRVLGLLLVWIVSITAAEENSQTIGVEISQTSAIGIVTAEIGSSFHVLITEAGGPQLGEHARDQYKQEAYLRAISACLERATLAGMPVERLKKDTRELVTVFANLITLPTQVLEERLAALTKGMVPQVVSLTDTEAAACRLYEQTVDAVVAHLRNELKSSDWTIRPAAVPQFVRDKALAVNAGGSSYADLEKEYLRQLVEDSLLHAQKVNKRLLQRMLDNVYYVAATRQRIAQATRRSDDEVAGAVAMSLRRAGGSDSETIEFQNIPGDIMSWVTAATNAAYEFKP